jgi:iron complex outermembrane receptor protein
VTDVKTKDSALTPKFSLTYAATSEVNVYATAAKGYRDGGTSQPIPTAECGVDEPLVGLASGSEPGAYKPDSLWNYEGGVKALLADNSLSINADVYEIEWSNIQQQIRIPHCGFHFTTNVGSARATGTEFDMRYAVPFLRGLTVGGSASYENGEITSSTASSPAQRGAHLLFAPEWTATVSASYTRPIAEGWSVMLRADNFWQGKSYGDFLSNQTDYINPAYSVLNAGVSIIDDQGLEFGLFAKNLLDNTTIIRSPSVAGVTEGYTVPPREVGALLKKSF